MLATALIAFREFFEAFLIVGVFLGVSRKLGLKRELEIGLAALTGLVAALAMGASTYFASDMARSVFTEENAEYLGGYLLVFSGLFIAYMIFSLHDAMNKGRKEVMKSAEKQIALGVFDISLFFTIVLLIVREGFEISLFTASASLFTDFLQNFLGLLAGLLAASVLGMSTVFAFVKLPIDKVFRYTKYLILLVGAAMTQNGITIIMKTEVGIDLSTFGRLPLGFLPDAESALGHLLGNLAGLTADLSLARVAIMVAYIAAVYYLFMRERPAEPAAKSAA